MLSLPSVTCHLSSLGAVPQFLPLCFVLFLLSFFASLSVCELIELSELSENFMVVMTLRFLVGFFGGSGD